MSECGNCKWSGEPLIKLEDIPYLFQRIEPGGVVPSGECPECGALCYLVKEENQVTILYTNWKGEIGWRNIRPVSITYGTTERHPEPQWLILAFDIDKNAERYFAMKDIKEWK